MTYGSSWACLAKTECRIDRNLGFSRRESGVGGSWDVEPMARSAFGGEVDRRVRR